MKVKFIGATETVTGSKHLLITEKGTQVLLDCGLYQGGGRETDALNRQLALNPSQLEAVILSHAHIDHSGNLPSLVREGFNGRIYCTPATYEVCEILLMDSAHIHESDIRDVNKRRIREGKEPLDPLYTTHDVERCLKHFRPVPYHTEFAITDEISFLFTDAGHILGSAAVHVTAHEEARTTRLTFTGDIGRYTDLLMKNPEAFPQADHIICESTYGNKLHPTDNDAEARLLEIVKHTCVVKQGKLIIPAFSLGRTQEIVFVLDKLTNAGLLPNIKVYVDSPLSTSATNIMRKHAGSFNESLQEYIKKDPDPFGFNNLSYIRDREDSIKLNDRKEPCIIISASGMMEAGRVKHHIYNTIGDPRNTILAVGYCAPDSLGGKLIAGRKEVRIFGSFLQVRAEVEVINSYSAHADYKEMIRFLSCQDKEKVKTIFLVHGEKEVKPIFRNALLAEGYSHVVIPSRSEEFELN